MSDGPEPAALPPEPVGRQCPLPRGCGRYLPGSQFASSNSDGRHPYCLDCGKRHKEEREASGARTEMRRIGAKVRALATADGELRKFPRIDEISATMAATFEGGVQEWAEEWRADFEEAGPKERPAMHRMFLSAAIAAGKLDIAERKLDELTATQLQEQIETLLMSVVLDKSPNDLAQLLGAERLRELLALAEGTVDGKVITEDE